MAGDPLQVRGYGLSHLLSFALGILGGKGDSSNLSQMATPPHSLLCFI